MLAENQVIVQAIAESKQATPFMVRYLLTTGLLFAPGARELAVPYSQEGVQGASEGSFGPVSLEAAFILALHFAGVDLERLARFRRAATPQGPLAVYTAAEFQALSTTSGAVQPSRIDPYRLVTINNRLHTTIFSQRYECGNLSVGTGVYCGIDFHENIAIDKTPAPTDNDFNSWKYYNTNIFAFLFHAVNVCNYRHHLG